MGESHRERIQYTPLRESTGQHALLSSVHQTYHLAERGHPRIGQALVLP